MKPGDIATLKVAYKGYRRIELLERLQYTWLVRICESGKDHASIGCKNRGKLHK